jgi:alcohol dehydrogenase class IV
MEVAAAEIERFGEAMRTHDPIGRAEELARLSGFTLLRHLGVPRDDLPALAEAAAQRGGAKANPRPASADDVLGLFEGVW